jgi:hypothetical protein
MQKSLDNKMMEHLANKQAEQKKMRALKLGQKDS